MKPCYVVQSKASEHFAKLYTPVEFGNWEPNIVEAFRFRTRRLADEWVELWKLRPEACETIVCELREEARPVLVVEEPANPDGKDLREYRIYEGRVVGGESVGAIDLDHGMHKGAHVFTDSTCWLKDLQNLNVRITVEVLESKP